MKNLTIMALSLLAATLSGADAPAPLDPVRDLLDFAPEAEDYVVLYDVDCFSGNDRSGKKYLKNYSEKYEKTKPVKIGYFLRLEGNDGKIQRVFATIDPFADKIIDYGFPRYWPPFPPLRRNVKNLTVKSDVPGVKNGTFPSGNLEVWLEAATPKNSAGVPGASDDAFDIGDEPLPRTLTGCFQLHNTAEKQTVLSVNRWFLEKNGEADVGIGNAPGKNTDWTNSHSGANFKNARMLILLKPQE